MFSFGHARKKTFFFWEVFPYHAKVQEKTNDSENLDFEVTLQQAATPTPSKNNSHHLCCSSYFARGGGWHFVMPAILRQFSDTVLLSRWQAPGGNRKYP